MANQNPSQFVTPRWIGKGPFFKAASKTPKPTEFSEDYVIQNLYTIEGVNRLSTANVEVEIPAHLIKKITKEFESLDAFIQSKFFQHVTICLERPPAEKILYETVVKDLFQSETFFHGILTSASSEPLKLRDSVLVKLVFRPDFWLLSQQNNYRSFENKTAREIIEEVFQSYQNDNKKFVTEWFCDPLLKRTQTLQVGETDFEFVKRLMEEEGLVYFFYHTNETCVLVITNKFTPSLKKIKEKFPDNRKNLKDLPYFVADVQIAENLGIESLKMPLLNYRRNFGAPISNMKVYASPDYRDDTILESETEKKNVPKLQKMLWKPTTHLMNKNERQHYLDSCRENQEAHMRSSLIEHVGNTRSYGFIPIWQRQDIDGLEKKLKCYPCVTEHWFNRASFENVPESKFVPQVSLPLYLQVSFGLLNEENEQYIPPFVDEFSFSSNLMPPGPFLATVVEFKAEDKTEKNHEVTNSIRVKLPWHKKGESIKARNSTFWAGDQIGSVFMPEIGSEVFIIFPEGQPDYPVILGSFYNSRNDYPLKDLSKRDTKGSFGARGVVFNKEEGAEITYKNVKSDKGDVPTLILKTNKDLAQAASNIKTDAKESLFVTSKKSDFKSKDKIDMKAPLIAANGLEVSE